MLTYKCDVKACASIAQPLNSYLPPAWTQARVGAKTLHICAKCTELTGIGVNPVGRNALQTAVEGIINDLVTEAMENQG
jgi:hypothetical protein